MRCNVVFIVLDTLREDSSKSLAKLQDLGFRKYENAIAPSNWTIPSHASMFTGMLPSLHGIHETAERHVEGMEVLAAANQKVQENGILGELARSGYVTHALTTNPFVSPVFGFPFQSCDVFDESGPITEVRRYVRESGGSWTRAIVRMMRDGKTRFLARRTYKSVKRRMPWLLDRAPLEKGSRYVTRFVEDWKASGPFMLYLNLMEAHQPYSWNDGKPGAEATYCFLTGKRFRHDLRWKEKYKAHADLAVSRALDAVRAMERFPKDTLYVVTSDHGQHLGEEGKYDHGYFLDDALLRVPLYIKYPEGLQPFGQREPQVSTRDIPLVVESVLYGTRVELGTDPVVSECFGPQWDLLRYAQNEEEKRSLSAVYRRKLRFYTGEGAFSIEPGTGTIEDRQGGIPDGEVARCLSRI